MKEMHIGCVETDEFKTKSDKEVMLEALYSIGLYILGGFNDNDFVG